MSTPSPKIDLPILSMMGDTKVTQAAQALGKLLAETPEYQAFLQALKDVNHDLEVQKLSAKIREHDRAIQWGQGNVLEHHGEMETLQVQLESLPLIQTYHNAERVFVHLCREINQTISESAGVEFAPNARKSSCGCGG
ncbi:MAG: YlbF family regulator [Anaerolineales bacterium]|nr:YlbF family regulator [Anaerolineales bacterium]NUQ83211.1 YlbF family regulator [Anaerolineales bacterium]